MRSLIERMQTSPTDDKVKELVNMINETNLDFIMSEKLNSNTSDIEINTAIDGVTNAFFQLSKVLKQKGYVNINGYKITSKKNI